MMTATHRSNSFYPRPRRVGSPAEVAQLLEALPAHLAHVVRPDPALGKTQPICPLFPGSEQCLRCAFYESEPCVSSFSALDPLFPAPESVGAVTGPRGTARTPRTQRTAAPAAGRARGPDSGPWLRYPGTSPGFWCLAHRARDVAADDVVALVDVHEGDHLREASRVHENSVRKRVISETERSSRALRLRSRGVRHHCWWPSRTWKNTI